MTTTNRNRNEKGNAITEFALASTVIFMIAFGAADLGRLFYDAIAVHGAATAGTQYATSSVLASADLSDSETAGRAALEDVDGATVTVTKFCDCPDSPGAQVNCETDRCSGYGLSRYYVRTRVTNQFSTIVDLPGIPGTADMDLSNWTRVR
jgi:Flp pilus assembly protein TadG